MYRNTCIKQVVYQKRPITTAFRSSEQLVLLRVIGMSAPSPQRVYQLSDNLTLSTQYT